MAYEYKPKHLADTDIDKDWVIVAHSPCGTDIPAWSLHRLIEMMPPGYREQIRVGTTDNPYEYMYQVIGRLVYVGEFNKKYLEE